MIARVTHVMLIVRDQQEALDWYTQKLGFKVASNDPMPGDMPGRWIAVAPVEQSEIQIVLAPAEWTMQNDVAARTQSIGKSSGFILASTDCRADYEALKAKGVEFISPPQEMPWGLSAFFVDLYGYTHNLVEAR